MLDFPNSPTVGQIFAGAMGSFSWDGVKWIPLTGATMNDAPSDGNTYGRKNAAWTQTIGEAPSDGQPYARMNAAWSVALSDAPSDGKQYARQSAAWAAITATGGLVALNYYSASQTITIPAGCTRAVVEMWGATGASGGITGTGASGGTGAGGYLEKLLTGLTPGNTLVYTQGAAGVAGAGGNGSVTLLASGTQAIGTLTCNGSNGSGGGGASNYPGTSGGTASGGDVNLTGQAGMTWGQSMPTGAPLLGGSTMRSIGANGLYPGVTTTGNPGNPGGLKIAWYA
jgi:hypothetical protein